MTTEVDHTEQLRREHQAELNSEAAERTELEKRHGQVWSTEQLRNEFEVLGFMAPFVSVRRLKDRKKGILAFQHSPRFYFNWQES